MRVKFKDYIIEVRKLENVDKYQAHVYLPAGEKLAVTNSFWNPSGAILQAEDIIHEADKHIKPWFIGLY